MRRCQTLHLVLLMVFSSCLGAFLTKYFSPNTAEAQIDMDYLKVTGMELVDDVGKTRLALGMVDQSPMISFFDVYGKPAMTIGNLKGSPSLFMYENSRPIIAAGVELGGDTGFFIFDKFTNPIAVVGLDKKGGPIVVAKDKHGKSMGAIGLYNGEPYFYLQDSNEKVIWSKTKGNLK